MAVPNAVKRKADKARQMAKVKNPGNLTQTPNQVSATNPQDSLNDGTGDQLQVADPAVLDQTVNAPTVLDNLVDNGEQVPAMQDSSVPLDDYKTRYTRLRESRNLDKERVAELEAENASLRAELADKVSPRGNEASSPLQLTDEEREGLSDEELKIYDLIGSKVEKTIVKNENDDLRQRELDFFSDLDSLLWVGWGGLNNDAGFIEWLSAQDGLSGKTRQENLKIARDKLDSATVAKFFSAYHDEVQQVTVATDENGFSQQPVGTVEPGRGAAQANPSTAGGGVEIISAADITAFNNAKNKLIRQKRMTPELRQQFAEKEAEIRKAHAEGRVR